MNRKLFFIVPLVAFFVLAGFLLRGLWLNPREVPSPLIGKAAPVFERAVLGNPQQVFSAADMKGQVWMLNVWASWCAPCREEHPLLNALAQRKLVPIVGINYKDHPGNARTWLAKLGDPYLVSIIDVDGRVGIDFGVYGVPETFIIDKSGVIRLKHIGPLTQEAIERKVVPLLAELGKS